MPTLLLSVEPRLVGPVSVGTVDIIKILREHLGIDLVMAKRYVDRCVFDGEQPVRIPLPSLQAGNAILSALEGYPPPALVRATIEPDTTD